MVSMKAIAMAVASLRPAPVPKYRGLDEPRINIIPKKAQRKNTKTPSAAADLRSVLPERQSVTANAIGRLAVIVVPQPQVVGGQSLRRPIFTTAS
jgi:hypothetical protein